MISSRLSSKSARTDFKKNIPWMIMYFVILFFMIPLAYLFGLQNVTSQYFGEVVDAAYLSLLHNALHNHAVDTLGMGLPTAVMMLLSVVEAYHQFGFLHRRREIDFYHALPVTRRQLFFGHFTGGLAILLLPYYAVELLGFVFAVISGLTARELVLMLLMAALLTTILVGMMYALTAVAIMLTGNALTGILGTMVLAGYFPLLALLLSGLPSIWFVTYVESGEQLFFRILLEISPVMQAISYVTSYFSRFQIPVTYTAISVGFLFRVLCGFCAATVLAMLAMKLYEKRALERAGEAMAFPVTEAPIRVLLELLAGIAGMSLMRSLGRSLPWIFFGCIVATVLTHVIVQMIYRADAKRVFDAKGQLALTCAAGALLTAVLAFDLFGYDSYLPNEEQIEGAELSLNAEYDGCIYGENRYDGSEDIFAFVDDASWREGAYIISGDREVEALLAMAEAGIEQVRENDRASYSIFGTRMTYEFRGGTSYASGGTEETFWGAQVTWHLKNGKTVSRSYALPLHKLKDAYETVFDSEAYKEQLFPVLTMNRSAVTGMAYEEKMESFPLAEADADALFDALLMDTRAMTAKDRADAYPIGHVRIYIEPSYATKLLGYLSAYDYRALYIKCPVYACEENVLAALSRAGISVGHASTYFDSLTEMNLSIYVARSVSEGHMVEVVVTDPAELAVLKENLVLYEYQGTNPYAMALCDEVSVFYPKKDSEMDSNLYDYGYYDSFITGQLLENEKTLELVEKYKNE